MRLGSLAGGKLLIAIGLLLSIFLLLPSAQASSHIVWERCLGGSDDDKAYSIQQTITGNYIIAGGTHSWNKNVEDNRGFWDYWIVNLGSVANSGVRLWWCKMVGGYDES